MGLTYSGAQQVLLTREELYEQVWAAPMRHLCQKYGRSDSGMAKLCHRHKIPRPTRGYWAKLAHGKTPLRRSLPPCNDPELITIRLYLYPPPPPEQNPPSPPKPPPPPVPLDPDILELLDKARSLPKLIVPQSVPRFHPLVVRTRKGFTAALRHNYAPHDPRITPSRIDGNAPLSIYVSKEHSERAFLFFDTLIRTVESIGGSVTTQINPHARWDQSAETIVTIAGEKVASPRIKEMCRKLKTRNKSQPYQLLSTGRFILEGPGYLHFGRCEDADQRRIEEGLNQLLIGWIESAGRIRQFNRARAIHQKRAEIEERERLAREAERQQRIKELQAKQQEESDRIDQLRQQAMSWRESQIIRDFIQAVVNQAMKEHGCIEDGSDMALWIEWAQAQARRLDPLVSNPPSILDETIE